jgi:hypothetical protein
MALAKELIIALFITNKECDNEKHKENGFQPYN